MSNATGDLILAGTPIGDADDASPALGRALLNADIIAAEDTRRAQALFKRLEIEPKARLVSYFEGNEASRTPDLVAQMQSGLQVVLITDAGMPSVSDPGYRLVNAAIEAGLRVSAVPGPSAVLTALAVSGLPSDRFCFEGFLARKSGERKRRLTDLAVEERTMIFFEAPHRLADCLGDMAEILGADRKAAICRELTKTHEEVKRGRLAELTEWAKENARGEITIVVSGARPSPVSQADALELVGQRVASGEKLSHAVSQVAAETGVDRKALYNLAVQQRKANRDQ